MADKKQTFKAAPPVDQADYLDKPSLVYEDGQSEIAPQEELAKRPARVKRDE